MPIQWPDTSKLKKIALSFKDEGWYDGLSLEDVVEVVQPTETIGVISESINVHPLDVRSIEQPENEENVDDDVETDDDAVDEEDNEEEMMMQWLDNDCLEPTHEIVLALNQYYQDSMGKMIDFYESKIRDVHAQQKIAGNTLNMLAPNSDMIAKNLSSKVPALLYISPFFRDAAGMCPPANDESKRFSKESDFDMLVQRPRKWTDRDEKKLRDAVHQNAFDKIIRPYLNKKENLKEKIKRFTENAPNDITNINRLNAELHEKEKEIKSLRRKRVKDQLDLNSNDEIDWSHIALSAFNGSRSQVECQLEWMNEIHPKINRTNWKMDELNKLKEIVESKTEPHWDEIAAKLGSQLNDDLIRKQWTPDEDKTLADTVELNQVGNYIPWDLVVCNLDGRTRNQCQIRWSRTLDPNLKHGRWDEEEDKRLIRALHKFGTKDWGKIAQIVVGRTDSQCRERWCTVLDVGIKDDRWTEKEDSILKIGVKVFGLGQWARVRRLLPGRTAPMCKTRYKSIRKSLARLKKIKAEKNYKSSKRLKREFCTDDSQEGCNESIKTKRGNNSYAERKKRVREWFSKNHGPLPKAALDKDVGAFLNSLPDGLKVYLESKLSMILTD